MPYILTDRASAFFSAQALQATSNAIDARACRNYGYLYASAGKAGSGTGSSALGTLQVSHDSGAWLTVEQFTAVPGDVITAQLVGYYPYYRAVLGPSWTATGATGTATAVMYMFFAPGIG